MTYSLLDDELEVRALLSYLAHSSAKTLRKFVKNHGVFETYKYIVDPAGEQPPQIRDAMEKWSEFLKVIDPKKFIESFTGSGGVIIKPGDKLWPKNFQYLGDDEPIALFALGNCENLDLLSQKSVSLVGSRNCTAYGQEVAMDLAGELGNMGYTIVSGGAVGIDIAAHRGALNSGSKCGNIAFMPTGILRLYPKSNDLIFKKMLDNGATFLAEYPGRATPKAYQFLERNRLIAGFSDGTVVVEASWRSGAISTANWAMKYNKPLGVVPGKVTAPNFSGCHHLIREYNATVITSADDVDEMCSSSFDLLKAQLKDDEMSRKYARKYDDLSTVARDIMYEFQRKKTQTVDELAGVLFFDKKDVLAELAKLQLSGLVEALGNDRYTRKDNK